uniref:Uncharacterized protein n=1 Tax=Anguilla anguilla TaxID=7936 RepID=A0A0E9WY81_ANGAN
MLDKVYIVSPVEILFQIKWSTFKNILKNVFKMIWRDRKESCYRNDICTLALHVLLDIRTIMRIERYTP